MTAIVKHRSEKNRKYEKRLVHSGRALSVSYPCVMGILNVTPDSFTDGGKYLDTHRALDRIGEMIDQGASIIDIGGESTRPGARPVPEQMECRRVLPVLEKGLDLFPKTFFSVDTTKYGVARQALGMGAHMINDVSGLRKEPRLIELCAEYGAALVIMHSIGTPETMQDSPRYDDVVRQVAGYLKEKGDRARKCGVEQVIVDPGIGFGKTTRHNLALIGCLQQICEKGYPVMIGASRKSMIGAILGDEKTPRAPEDRLSGTIAIHYHALLNGADILRVHDVRAASDSLAIFRAVKAALPS